VIFYPQRCYRKLDPSRNENFYVNKHGMRTAAYAPTLLEPETCCLKPTSGTLPFCQNREGVTGE
jgi:hypothetical protein